MKVSAGRDGREGVGKSRRMYYLRTPMVKTRCRKLT